MGRLFSQAKPSASAAGVTLAPSISTSPLLSRLSCTTRSNHSAYRQVRVLPDSPHPPPRIKSLFLPKTFMGDNSPLSFAWIIQFLWKERANVFLGVLGFKEGSQGS